VCVGGGGREGGYVMGKASVRTHGRRGRGGIRGGGGGGC